jgi:hypothetical protein
VPTVPLGGLSTIAVVLLGAAIFRDLFHTDRYEPRQIRV